jgi:dicarboxylate/amino acid:cation (Na+ or H+) symporter, DAACS family
MPSRRSDHQKIFLGMLAGIVAGIAIRYSGLSIESIQNVTRYVKPIGDVFMRMLFMTVMPLLISGLALGVAEIGDIQRIGKIGLRTLLFTVVVSVIAVLIGLTLVSVVQPGSALSPENRQMLLQRFPLPAGVDSATSTSGRHGVLETLVKVVPKNPVEDMARAFDPSYSGGGILAVIFFAFMMGIAMALCDPEKVSGFKSALEGLYETIMKLIAIGMKLAPLGVFSLLFSLSATMGFSIVLILSRYVAVVMAGLALHLFGVYGILLKIVGRMSPAFFYKNTSDVMLVAFSTSSSNATLPTALRVAVENLKLRRDVSRFVLIVGATANQNGSALYEGVTALFLAQCFGIPLSFTQQIFVMVLCVLAGMGTAGVPGGSLPAVMMILAGIGVPVESMGIILGVDRLLDMSRTVVNVQGDLTAAVVVNRFELKQEQQVTNEGS